MKDKVKKIKILFNHFLFPHILALGYMFDEWKELVWDCDLNEELCCSGQMCSCGGHTIRETYA